MGRQEEGVRCRRGMLFYSWPRKGLTRRAEGRQIWKGGLELCYVSLGSHQDWKESSTEENVTSDSR